MKKLQRIGYWNSANEEEYIWPQEITSKEIPPYKNNLVGYIKQGVPCIEWRGWSTCRICKEHLGTYCLTDGIWIWPEKLDHYIEKHNIILPDEFIQFAKNNNWKILKAVSKEFGHGLLAPYADDFWKEWCKSNRNPEQNITQKVIENAFEIPSRSNISVLELKELYELFFVMERGLDCIVDTLIIPSYQRLDKEFKENMDEDNGKEQIWSSTIHRKGDLILAGSSKYEISCALICKNKTTYILCQNEKSMLVGTNLEKKYCPKLGEIW